MTIEDKIYRWLFDDGHTTLKLSAIFFAFGLVYLVGVAWLDIRDWIHRNCRWSK
jgi:hypothetical protein